MGDKRADTKPLSFIGKSEIAQKADTLEARTEAKKEAEAQAEHLHIIIDYGVKENGETRPATAEEKAKFESWAE